MKDIPVRHLRAEQKELGASESFTIRKVYDVLGGKDLFQELHRHDFFYILALKKGKGSHEIDFVPIQIVDNCVFILRPGQVHKLNLKAGSSGHLLGFKKIFFSSSKTTDQYLRKASTTNFYSLDPTSFDRIHSLLENILDEKVSERDGHRDIIKANLCIFFVELTRQSRNDAQHTADYKQDRLEAFLELLEQNVFSQKQPSYYADKLNLTPYQLNAITKASLGKTCSEIIIEYTVLESKRQLLGTSNQINQIADKLGYDDVSYFIRFFKKHTGLSPEAFRHKFQ